MESKESKPKLKLAVYWGAACGGCCVSVLDVHEALYDVVAAADLVFWPIALDTKYKDVEAMEDGFIDVMCAYGGHTRTGEFLGQGDHTGAGVPDQRIHRQS
jgi:F420-non-reducing hydrogenase small subunit